MAWWQFWKKKGPIKSLSTSGNEKKLQAEVMNALPEQLQPRMKQYFNSWNAFWEIIDGLNARRLRGRMPEQDVLKGLQDANGKLFRMRSYLGALSMLPTKKVMKDISRLSSWLDRSLKGKPLGVLRVVVEEHDRLLATHLDFLQQVDRLSQHAGITKSTIAKIRKRRPTLADFLNNYVLYKQNLINFLEVAEAAARKNPPDVYEMTRYFGLCVEMLKHMTDQITMASGWLLRKGNRKLSRKFDEFAGQLKGLSTALSRAKQKPVDALRQAQALSSLQYIEGDVLAGAERFASTAL